MRGTQWTLSDGVTMTLGEDTILSVPVIVSSGLLTGTGRLRTICEAKTGRISPTVRIECAVQLFDAYAVSASGILVSLPGKYFEVDLRRRVVGDEDWTMLATLLDASAYLDRMSNDLNSLRANVRYEYQWRPSYSSGEWSASNVAWLTLPLLKVVSLSGPVAVRPGVLTGGIIDPMTTITPVKVTANTSLSIIMSQPNDCRSLAGWPSVETNFLGPNVICNTMLTGAPRVLVESTSESSDKCCIQSILGDPILWPLISVSMPCVFPNVNCGSAVVNNPQFDSLCGLIRMANPVLIGQP